MRTISLDGQWTLRSSAGKSWLTRVPGTVLETLLEQGEIRDPFDGMNELEACRVMDQEYSFEREFALSPADLALPRLDLVFEGIDTVAAIELNGQPVASVDNMHRTWRFDIKHLAVPGTNRLRLVFSPAVAWVQQAAKDNPDVTYSGGSGLLWTGSLRKAHYMFGWDWGPRLPDAGIWRSCRVEAYRNRLAQVHVHQDHQPGRVILSVRAETEAAQLSLTLSDPDGAVLAEQTGSSDQAFAFRIDAPRLWWPNGLGDQPLYTLSVRSLSEAGPEDERILRLGLRTMTVATEKDQWGSEFAFCCNGVRFFAMGADYIPEDNLLARVRPEGTRKLLKDCRDSNFNCVRVWGGGIYPGEDFFEACDEMGLVVWLDLMFACNVYKLTDSFRENIIREAEDNLRRVRHHASLGLICGNNEMETAWLSWKDVSCLSPELKAQYLEQFENVLRKVCLREAPDSFYWPSSPSSGGGFDDPNDLNRGDVHDWSVWHGRRPFSDFTERFPRFCSEFGFESFPCMDTLRTFIHRPEDMNPFSEVMEFHQKCENGNATMLHYLSSTLRYPFSMEKLVYSTQYLQAEAMRAGVEHWRRNRGRCMGAIYWQLNDCWPVASWASIDSLGRWKALQYAARRFFAPVLISLQPREDGFGIHISNERREAFSGSAVIHVRDAEGRILRTERLPAACGPMSSVCIGTVQRRPGEELLPVVQCLLLNEQGETVSENEALYTLPKHFPFAAPHLHAECRGSTVLVSSDVFCLGVELEAGDTRFSDNWFSLWPGEVRSIRADRELDPDRLVLRCLSSDDQG